ncbi:MAG: DNA methyltransferase [Thiotrichaceae bacterium]
MPLSWNEIKTRAIIFIKEWTDEAREQAESKTFWNDFFNIFGISRRRVATFEQPVKKLNQHTGFIDLLWKGVLLIEHKSRGENLDHAAQQAKDYCGGLKSEELPKYLLVSDFQRFRLHNLDSDTHHEFELPDLLQHIHLFGFIAGYETRVYHEEDPVNIQAAELMGQFHDRLRAVGYDGHDLEVYLVRLLFCLFADDTVIFEKGIFWQYIDLHTKIDGSDLAMHLDAIFEALNTPFEKRLKNLDENLQQFPYINGQLFAERLRVAAFDSKMRQMLLKACALDWGKISPAIFGSMFQAVMNPQQRRNLGAHYTSEKNIQKLIKPLFLDELHREFTRAKGNKAQLKALHEKLAKLRFLDPACGCGNFLIVSYRELRQLEIQVLRELHPSGQGFLNIQEIVQVDVDQFYGIEYEEFACQIAQVAMWLIDHQMNMLVSQEFGQYFVRLPLTKAAKIVQGNSLHIDWEAVVAKTDLHYILGNPPFVGKHLQNEQQKADIALIFHGVNGAGVLDYVASWYLKAARYIQQTNIRCAFVSTNSVAQGEQVGILWHELYHRYQIKIHFAHRTFAWKNEAKGNAAVHCVIIGFGTQHNDNKVIFDYDNVKGEPTERKVKNVNPYLVEGSDLVVLKSSSPIVAVPTITFGSMPNDGGHLLFTEAEKQDFLLREPAAKMLFKPLISAKEWLNNIPRWCLWLQDISPNELRQLPEVLKRIKAVQQYRLKSQRGSTKKLADIPALFGEIRVQRGNYIVIPRVSSEMRTYIPMGFFSNGHIVSDSCLFINEASLFDFGVIHSQMHMAWIKYTCGRLKSDFRYSNTIVYNNFPFPQYQQISPSQKRKVEQAAQQVLDIRANYPESSLADLYDSLTMPPDLLKAHQMLDKAVDLCYRQQSFSSEINRIEYLFSLYEQLISPMLNSKKTKKSTRPRS